MDQDKAHAILKALAAGIDPHTGAVFPASDPYRHPDVVRALHAALDAHPFKKTDSAPARPFPSNAGKPWSAEEDALLLAGFAAGESLEALAARHGRSRTGIEARLAKHGKVQLPSALPSTRLKAREHAAPYTL